MVILGGDEFELQQCIDILCSVELTLDAFVHDCVVSVFVFGHV